jgi:DNA (cytosine-5)-methyltransferase 1
LIPAIGFGWQNAATQGDDVEVETARSLRTVTSPGVLTPNLAVRRLTPTECERLMGWPDDWTAHRADGTPIADGPRYRMCGNGVVAPVAQWIAHRMLTVPAVKNTEPAKDTP